MHDLVASSDRVVSFRCVCHVRHATGCCRYQLIAFQKFDKSYDYKFGFLMDRHVDEHVYDLRFVRPDNTFDSFVSASNFRAVAEIVKLGNLLSKLYNIPFCDYVKQALMKSKVLDFTDGDDWPTV